MAMQNRTVSELEEYISEPQYVQRVSSTTGEDAVVFDVYPTYDNLTEQEIRRDLGVLVSTYGATLERDFDSNGNILFRFVCPRSSVLEE